MNKLNDVLTTLEHLYDDFEENKKGYIISEIRVLLASEGVDWGTTLYSVGYPYEYSLYFETVQCNSLQVSTLLDILSKLLNMEQ